MTIRVNTDVRNDAAAAVRDRVDGGSGPGKLRIYSGAQPASPATAPSGTLLLEFTLSDPSFGTPGTGVITLDDTPALAQAGLATGTAGWFRFVNSTEAAGSGLGVLDGAVSLSGGGGELILSTTSVNAGVTFTITPFTVTMPAA